MSSSDSNNTDWRELCQQAIKEQDPQKFIKIVQQLIEALDERSEGSSKAMSSHDSSGKAA